MIAGTIKGLTRKKASTREDELYSSLGDSFLQIRSRMEASREYVRKAAGISRNAVYGMESGKRGVRLRSLLLMADALGYEVVFKETPKSEKAKKEILEYNKKVRARI